MIEEIQEIKSRIIEIEKRNRKVEENKKWETSKTRIFLICTITYIVAFSYMKIANTGSVLYSALVPVIGFYLSSLSMPFVKRLWMKF